VLRADANRYATRVSGAKAILIGLALAGAGCAEAGPAARRELLVYAAASTRDALAELATRYEREAAVELVFSFGSSHDLANQIVAAGKADVFLSADERAMDKVQEAGLVAAGSRHTLLSNQLVVIEPAGRTSLFREPFEPAQLAVPQVRRLSLGNVATVPAGRYARAWLEQCGAWDALKARVLPALDARAALAAVESAGADAGIVYKSDAAHSTRVRIAHAVPLSEGPRIAYPLAVIGGRTSEAQARAFAAFLASPPAQAVFERHGFLSPDDSER
jgi:molybdate transport system substrate-binding protein